MAKKKAKKRSAGRGATFTVTELINLYTIVREVLHISAPHWRTVADQHNGSWGNPVRNSDSCWKKFGQDREAKLPTSDPNCPARMLLAKWEF